MLKASFIFNKDLVITSDRYMKLIDNMVPYYKY